ncbi:hypothetical protein NN561_017628 [Cricetulus griseus]
MRVCVRALQFSRFREARVSACSRGSSLRPPCPAGRSLPPSPSPLPGGPGSGTPQPSRRRCGGDDLGANDELIPFQDEGGEEQEPSSDSASAQRDLDEVKSSLVNESENQSSSSDSEAERRPQPARDAFQKPRDYFAEVRRPQDGAFFKGPAYPGYPFLMIPDLSSPYLSNGPLSPGGARTVSVNPAVPGPVGAGPWDAPPGSAVVWGMGPPAPILGRTCLQS